MRPRTVVVLVAVLALLAGGGAYALVSADGGGTLDVLWVSDTPRNTTLNHHGVGAHAGVVVAPVSEKGGSPAISRHSCSLVHLDPATGAVDWRWPVPQERCFLHALTRPAVADIDDDDSPEVVVGTIEDATVVLSENGTEQFRVPMETYSYGQPTVADLGGDGRREVVASDITGGVVVAGADGQVRWRGNVSGSVWASPLVADIDGDGAREVVVGSSEETVAFEADGTVLWRQGTSGGDVAAARTADGVAVVVAGFDGVAALDGATGRARWVRGLAAPALGSVGDGDGDGRPEAYLSVSGSDVAALSVSDGSEEWRTRLTTGDATTPPPVLADLTGEGDPELVAATSGGTVAVLDPADGGELAAYEREVPVWTAVTPANLTADPGRELLVRYGDGRVVALDYSS